MKQPKEGEKAAFDEFKLFYDSAEKVTDRRLTANRTNYSICIATLGAIAAIINWGISKPDFLITSAAAVIIISFMATLYCTLWIGQIKDFKQLNNAKFDVLNKMAPSLYFGEGYDDSHVSWSPFEREWEALKKAEAAQEINSINIIALNSSNIEFLIPRAFSILFVLIMLTAPIELYRNYDRLTSKPVPATSVPTSTK